MHVSFLNGRRGQKRNVLNDLCFDSIEIVLTVALDVQMRLSLKELQIPTKPKPSALKRLFSW